MGGGGYSRQRGWGGERLGGGGMRQQGRLDGGVVCVCFAVLGVPLGSTAWRVEGTRRGGAQRASLKAPSLHYQMVLMCIYV